MLYDATYAGQSRPASLIRIRRFRKYDSMMRKPYDVQERSLRHAVIVLQSDGSGAEAQGTETVMLNMATIDERIQHHETRVAGINRDAWIREAVKLAPVDGADSASSLMHRMRRTIGQSVVHCGEWLGGTPVAESPHPATNH